MSDSLLFLSIAGADLEVSQFIGILAASNNVQEISQLGLLQELLGQILEVSLGEWKFSSDMNLGFVRGDFNFSSQLTSLSVHLDAIVKELVEGIDIENFVFHWLHAVNGELGGGLLSALLNRFLKIQHTNVSTWLKESNRNLLIHSFAEYDISVDGIGTIIKPSQMSALHG
eukprot:CAMPEP_0202963234 /NCGR_PEP_ID=MMETSP1396-20130829/7215_1 /ASSEMBLY_ACC=CAM_ASM_000872 /TAXON_ID= /ORGANISM="Pseudokeronopsis sp., Strain Brazil" /LENGTH=170 /DNA_ID=CAMNT_0049684271 /DNA_START=145 /DNA_END=657 /DNA_ORIENTATION=-